MVTISLLRHAKSSWRKASLADFDRPLTPRGERAAARMGRFMAERASLPELVLCSPARRARDTLAIVLAETKHKPATLFERGLYHASAEHLLKRLAEIGPEAHHVMIVGHNPGLHVLALVLTGKAESAQEWDRLRAKLPTAALAQIAFASEGPGDIAPGSGLLRLFATPKCLAEADL